MNHRLCKHMQKSKAKGCKNIVTILICERLDEYSPNDGLATSAVSANATVAGLFLSLKTTDDGKSLLTD